MCVCVCVCAYTVTHGYTNISVCRNAATRCYGNRLDTMPRSDIGTKVLSPIVATPVVSKTDVSISGSDFVSMPVGAPVCVCVSVSV